MKLVRLALLTLGGEPGDLVGLQMSSQTTTTGPLARTVEDGTFLLPSEIKLPFPPKITRCGLIRIPERQRIEAEKQIEHFANLVGVARHCSRRLTSPHPIVALIPEDARDQALLDKARGFLSVPGNKGFQYSEPSLTLEHIKLGLGDRLDGAAILAEALCHAHQTGKFHEFLRLFERAFSRAGHSLVDPLASFLHGGAHEFTEQEVQNWIRNRDGVTHADRRSKILFESDVAWIIHRVVQAAYDVLLNKLVWRSPDAARRQLWEPISGTVGAEGTDLFVKGGEPLGFTFHVFDEFRKLPLHLKGCLTQIPEDWWTGAFLDRMP